jgi:hypothetical protein
MESMSSKRLSVSLSNHTIKNLFIFYLITTFGTVLSSIATFLSIETYFHSTYYLVLALSFKTLAACLFSWKANYLIKKIGVNNAFKLSQLLGCLILVVLFVGFKTNNFSVVNIGIMLISLPSTLAAILMTIALKVTSSADEHYVRGSANRELVVGVASLMGAFLSPILLYITNIYIVLLVDFMTYILGYFLILRVKIAETSKIDDSNSLVPVLDAQLAKARGTFNFICKTSASLLLVSFIPLIAASNHIDLTKDIPEIVRQSTWVVDFLTAIVAGFIYLNWSFIKKSLAIKNVLVLNSLVFIALLFYKNIYIILIVSLFISFTSYLSFQRFRDEYIICAGDNHDRIRIYSSFSIFQRNFIFFISPLLMGPMLTNLSLVWVFIISLLIQLFIYTVNFIGNKAGFE